MQTSWPSIKACARFQNVPSFLKPLSLLSCPNFQNGTLEKWAEPTFSCSQALKLIVLKYLCAQWQICAVGEKIWLSPWGRSMALKRIRDGLWEVEAVEHSEQNQAYPEDILHGRPLPGHQSSVHFPCQFSQVDIDMLHHFSSLVSLSLMSSSFLQPPPDF